MDVWRCQRLAFPLIVIGMNSIAIYCLSQWIQGLIVNSLKNCFGQGWTRVFGDVLSPITTGAAVLLVYWLILYWMYRWKIFLRI